MTDEKLTLRQAAARLGVSESAIRKRVERGTLRSDKGQDGKRYVYLDLAGRGADTMADAGADTSAMHERDALISELRAHNATLREQLESEREANRENRRIIAALTSRIPAIEAPAEPPPDAPGSAETAADEQQGHGPVPDAGGPQTPREPPSTHEQRPPRRGFWARLFGTPGE